MFLDSLSQQYPNLTARTTIWAQNAARYVHHADYKEVFCEKHKRTRLLHENPKRSWSEAVSTIKQRPREIAWARPQGCHTCPCITITTSITGDTKQRFRKVLKRVFRSVKIHFQVIKCSGRILNITQAPRFPSTNGDYAANPTAC